MGRAMVVLGDWLRFCEVADEIEAKPGYYEIHTVGQVALKAGIAINLRKRLTHHGQSLQRYLRGKRNTWTKPADVTSKRSILAKHLYFDSSIAPGMDLHTEVGRQTFLESCCRIRIAYMAKEIAREYERAQEQSGRFRYVGLVRNR